MPLWVNTSIKELDDARYAKLGIQNPKNKKEVALMKGTKEDHSVLRVIKTEQGYLHHNVHEGAYLEDDEVNYEFTEDPFKAYNFPSYSDRAPKYLWDDVKEKNIETIAEACEYLKGRLVEIHVKITTEWEEKQA